MSTLVVWDDEFTSYDLGPSHPLKPLRLELTILLARELGVLGRDGVSVHAPTPAGDDLLELVHDPMYIASVKRAPHDVFGRMSLRWGLGTEDNPIFPRMHEASALVTGATIDATRAVWEGRARHAVNISGGLHHAMRDRASGFCIYDDPAVGIAWMLAQGAERIAYVDVDVHHGDGVEAAFYDDPRVLTISLHESGRYLFPGSGFPDQCGSGDAVGTAVNVALPMGTGDAGWHRAFDAVVPPLLRAFRPQVLLTQHGADTHALDPLAHLLLSVDGQRLAQQRLHDLAHEVCGGRWIAVGGGGYEPVQVVPRTWTHLLATATGAPVDGATPNGWRDVAHDKGGEFAPTHLTDGKPVQVHPWEGGHGDPDDAVDRAVVATREAVFPHHGLDPMVAQG
ncbi:MAG TPA: acetoin utilization protein AcuC [Mycobacteriales bacterium]|nr:acetoin utilization protein AcuC [Mycobacteriales bacterium]